MFEAPLTVLCCPEVAAQLHSPADLLQHTLLRSYRADEWPLWFQAAGLPAHAPLTRSIVFDTSLAMLEAARQGVGVAPGAGGDVCPATGQRASGVRSPPK